MKTVQDITKGLDPQQALAGVPVAQPIKVDKQTADIVNTVFDKLQGIFPAWRQAWTDDKALYNAKREWIAGFIQGGINSDAQLAFGFQQARKSSSPFLPNVGQFVAWCKPTAEDMGLPHEADAWIQALQGKYSHPAVRIAAEATSTFDLRSARADDKALKQRFERNYAIVMRRAQTGQPLEGRISKGIGHDSMRPREQVQLEHSRQEAEALVIAQGIPANPQSARAMLLAKLGIRRDDHV
ncbi:replication protein P [Pseudomonas sp. NC02]|uniref:replication protein P n=1 Tax=Pseudomonas sp. NC02 TaxID=2067572 RepID=UPI000C828548|nr:replication protein P [Pseudomonas sp. NC02]AUO22506.1 Replication protein P [Pseudomonas sp. NC02]